MLGLMRSAGLLLAVALLPASANAADLALCTGGDRAARQVTCLVDGDTGWERGVKWRLADIDTPEYPRLAKCDAEVELAKTATYRMLELMNEGYLIEWSNQKDRTSEKRELVRVRLIDGRDAGAVLVEEGLALPWPNAPDAFCKP